MCNIEAVVATTVSANYEDIKMGSTANVAGILCFTELEERSRSPSIKGYFWAPTNGNLLCR